MGLPHLLKSPGLPKGEDTYNSGSCNMDENCQTQCTEATISATGDICCRNYKLHSSRTCAQGRIKKIFALPKMLGLDMPLDADDGAQDLAAAWPETLVHHLHRVLVERQPMSLPAQQQHPLYRTPAQLEPPHWCWDPLPQQQYLSLAWSGFIKEKGVRVGLKAVIHLGRAQAFTGVLGAASGVGR